jgi:hypothetical protein
MDELAAVESVEAVSDEGRLPQDAAPRNERPLAHISLQNRAPGILTPPAVNPDGADAQNHSVLATS